MRFTKGIVIDMKRSLMDAAPNERVRNSIADSVQISNPGDGTTHYAGMGYVIATKYGGDGARHAIAYLYGLGVGLSLWEAVHDQRYGVYRRIREAFNQVQRDLGPKYTDDIAQFGRLRARKISENV